MARLEFCLEGEFLPVGIAGRDNGNPVVTVRTVADLPHETRGRPWLVLCSTRVGGSPQYDVLSRECHHRGHTVICAVGTWSQMGIMNYKLTPKYRADKLFVRE